MSLGGAAPHQHPALPHSPEPPQHLPGVFLKMPKANEKGLGCPASKELETWAPALELADLAVS